jgi:hypothetical protein
MNNASLDILQACTTILHHNRRLLDRGGDDDPGLRDDLDVGVDRVRTVPVASGISALRFTGLLRPEVVA